MKVGIDIVEISQVQRLKDLERFLTRFYNIEEIKYISSKKIKREQTIAGIYAAKEAFLKSLEIGIGTIALKNVIIGHKQNNAPYLVITPEVKNLLAKYSFSKADISISHGGSYSVAICQLS